MCFMNFAVLEESSSAVWKVCFTVLRFVSLFHIYLITDTSGGGPKLETCTNSSWRVPVLTHSLRDAVNKIIVVGYHRFSPHLRIGGLWDSWSCNAWQVNSKYWTQRIVIFQAPKMLTLSISLSLSINCLLNVSSPDSSPSLSTPRSSVASTWEGRAKCCARFIVMYSAEF